MDPRRNQAVSSNPYAVDSEHARSSSLQLRKVTRKFKSYLPKILSLYSRRNICTIKKNQSGQINQSDSHNSKNAEYVLQSNPTHLCCTHRGFSVSRDLLGIRKFVPLLRISSWQLVRSTQPLTGAGTCAWSLFSIPRVPAPERVDVGSAHFSGLIPLPSSSLCSTNPQPVLPPP